MNLAQTFTPARAVAQHCAELTKRGPRPEERAESLSGWRRDVARELARELSELFSGARLEVKLSEPETLTGKAVFERIGPVGANSLLRCGSDEKTVLLSFEMETAIALTDRSFGGSGEPVLDVVTSLPRSAGLLVEEAARRLAQVITRVSFASAGATATSSMTGDVIIRSESAARLRPFTHDAECALFMIDISTDDAISWTGKLALPMERLDSLLPGLGMQSARPSQRQRDSAAIFGAIPLRLEGVLAEFELSLARLEQLVPGQCIPLAIARDMKLRIGERTFAHGNLGTIEDKMALRLTSIMRDGAPA